MRTYKLLWMVLLLGCYSPEDILHSPTDDWAEDEVSDNDEGAEPTGDGEDDDPEDSEDTGGTDEPAGDDDTSDEPAEDETGTETVADDALIVSASFPSSLDCGESATATVTVQNTGTATWTRGNAFKLGAIDDSDPFVGPDPRVWLQEGDVVGPDATWTFEMTLVAPDEGGSFDTDWRMVHENVNWFGESTSTSIEVECSDSEWSVVACARNGAEICDDELFTVPSSGAVMGLLCEGPNDGVGFVSTNTGPPQSDGMERCQGWEDQNLNAWDYLAYVDSFVCDTAGEVLVLDLSPWAGGNLWFGSHDNPAGGGSMTNICLVEQSP